MQNRSFDTSDVNMKQVIWQKWRQYEAGYLIQVTTMGSRLFDTSDDNAKPVIWHK